MSIMDIAKTLSGSILKIKDPELLENYVKLQESVMELYEENKRLREENETLQKSVDIEKGMVLEDGTYFTNHTGKKDGPFCTRCWDKEKSLIRLKVRDNGFANCPECKNEFDYKYKRESVTSRLNRTRL